MATVTGFTADRMAAIEDAAVVGGAVVGDNLILTTHGGDPIDAGNVRGPQGSTGLQGVQGIPGLNAAFIVRASDPSANLTLSGLQTVDGVVLAAGDRVLAKNQTTSANNGIYVVASGAWTRATDFDTSAEIAGANVLVQQGTTNGGLRYVTNFKSTDTLGTTAMSWQRNWDGFTMATVSFSGTTDSSGFATFTHGLGWTPRMIIPINQNPNSNFPVVWGVDSITSTTCRIRFMNASTAGAANALATGPQMMLCIR